MLSFVLGHISNWWTSPTAAFCSPFDKEGHSEDAKITIEKQ